MARARGRNLAQQVVQEMITEEEWRKAAMSLWEIATQGVKSEWAYCPQCRKRVQVDRADLRARADALQKLQEMGFGRPRESDEDKQSMIVNRTIVAPKIGWVEEANGG